MELVSYLVSYVATFQKERSFICFIFRRVREVAKTTISVDISVRPSVRPCHPRVSDCDLKMKHICSFETSVSNNLMSRNNLEDGRIHFNRSGRLLSHETSTFTVLRSEMRTAVLLLSWRTQGMLTLTHFLVCYFTESVNISRTKCSTAF